MLFWRVCFKSQKVQRTSGSTAKRMNPMMLHQRGFKIKTVTKVKCSVPNPWESDIMPMSLCTGPEKHWHCLPWNKNTHQSKNISSILLDSSDRVWGKLSIPQVMNSPNAIFYSFRIMQSGSLSHFWSLLICTHTSKKQSFCHSLLVFNIAIMTHTSWFWTPIER